MTERYAWFIVSAAHVAGFALWELIAGSWVVRTDPVSLLVERRYPVDVSGDRLVRVGEMWDGTWVESRARYAIPTGDGTWFPESDDPRRSYVVVIPIGMHPTDIDPT